ncbi:PAS domain S-box protein [Aestuariibacter halophilus]|uniref:PAS domain S-box protein n=1 Tax=Fluctibacter halophilus TaxID=226011 RepID=A0ABS8GA56_9ALTE|nr:PAS domain S-box protein [Aestuariibacter halophilus]MCC2617408.1 PAS domain S-box protein [Aestuariibacter halophilus]
MKRDIVEELLFLSKVLDCAKPVSLLKQLFMRSVAPIVVTNLGEQGQSPRILYANRSFCHVLGYELAELVGLDPQSLAAKCERQNDAPPLWDSFEQVLASEGYFNGIATYRCKDGNPFSFQVGISPLCSEQGERHYSMMVHLPLAPCSLGSDVIDAPAPVITDIELFDDDDDLFDMDSTENTAPEVEAISAEDYVALDRITDAALHMLIEQVRDTEEEVVFFDRRQHKGHHQELITHNLRALANGIFYLIDFNDVALALNEVADMIDSADPEQIQSFMLDMLRSLLEEIDYWLHSVFVDHTAPNVYTGPTIIVAAAQQAAMLLKSIQASK